MVIHDALLLAVQEQALVVETLTVCVPTLASTFWWPGEIEYVQEDGGVGAGGAGAGAGGVGAGGVGAGGDGGGVPAAT